MCYNSLFFFECYCDHRYLSVLSHSVPTRRPSDRPSSAGRLCASSAGSPSARCCGTALAVWDVVVVPVDALFGVAPSARTPGCGALVPGGAIVVAVCARASPRRRSEEHTSELQSLMRISYAVFCLKKKIHTLNHPFT